MSSTTNTQRFLPRRSYRSSSTGAPTAPFSAKSWALVGSILSAVCLSGCGGDDEGGKTVAQDPDNPFADQGDVFIDTPGNGNGNGNGNGSNAGSGSLTGGDGDCAPNFTGVVRDFTADHPDFEAFLANGISKGLVKDELGADSKPVYNDASPNLRNGAYFNNNGEQVSTTKANFDQWYRTTDGVNQEFAFVVPFVANGTSLSYRNDAFFPIDGRGYGNAGQPHNFWFTFELHTTFTYTGGEVFTFVGDDDLWAFINGKLAVDVGGVHGREQDTIDLDQAAGRLGLTLGQTYPLDLFHAERHTTESNFHIETNIVFNNCEPIVTDDVDIGIIQ